MTNCFFFFFKYLLLCPFVARQAWELKEGESFWKGSTKLVKSSCVLVGREAAGNRAEPVGSLSLTLNWRKWGVSLYWAPASQIP